MSGRDIYLDKLTSLSCSVACSAIHRATHPTTEPPTPKEVIPPPPPKQTVPQPGTVSAAGYKGPFATLADSSELKLLFERYPRLLSELEHIYKATQPPGPESERGGGKGGRGGYKARGGGGRGSHTWNQDRGTQDGLRRLTRARDVRGMEGEGVREFSKLVLQIIAEEEGDGRVDVDREMAEENARIISQLLNGEM